MVNALHTLLHRLTLPGKPEFALRTLVLMIVFLLSSFVNADNRLSASIDRSKIYATDTFTYELVGELDVQPGLGGLFSFGSSQISEPNIPGLEKDFEILDRQQKMSMQSINGKSQSRMLWRYTLAPLRSGKLTIPAAEYEGIKSKPIDIEVLPGAAPRDASTPPMVFIEVETDKKEAYVQEQIKFTVRLYSAGNLVAGDLSQPEALNAIIEPLGETKVYYRMAYNQRYEVRERNYLVFPQQSGKLELNALQFSGTMIDSRKRRRVRVREESESTNIMVNPPPANFTGTLWLPATSLHLNEKWDKNPEQLSIGDSLTRQIEIHALGLLASALPPLPEASPDGLKVYPDKAQTESKEHDSGAQALRRETRAYVAIKAGNITLPEMRIPWWDTVNDVQREAILPSRTIEIIAPSPQQKLPSISEQEPKTVPATSSRTDQDDEHIPVSTPPASNHFWYVVTALLLAGWATTTVWLLRNQAAQPSAKSKLKPKLDLWPQLRKAIKEQQADMPKLLVAWAQEHFSALSGKHRILGISDLKHFDNTLYEQVMAFERKRYAQNDESVHHDYDGRALLAHLESLRKTRARRANPTASIKPFYPYQQKTGTESS